jgi:hypothetical protein
MQYGITEAGESRGDLDGPDGDEFHRQAWRFALDAHDVLIRGDGAIDDVIELHRRLWTLLHDAPGGRQGATAQPLLAARRAIAARLLRWAEQDMDSLVA